MNPDALVEPPPGPPARRRGRAGRDLPAALAVGLVLGVVVLASLFVVKVAFLGVATLAIVIAVWELANALAVRGVRVPVVPLVAGAVVIMVGAYAGGPDAQLLGLALTGLAVLVWRLGGPVRGYRADTAAGVLVALYVPYLGGFSMLLLAPDDGAWRIVTFMVVVVCSDIGGYAAGVTFGRHPMAPTVSPKKSWEGFAGSLVLCVVAGVVTVSWPLGGSWQAGVLLGLAVVCTATLGDLGESLVKRDLGIKDMGSLLPGHGGMMDRLDSLLPSAPVTWLLLVVLVPVVR